MISILLNAVSMLKCPFVHGVANIRGVVTFRMSYTYGARDIQGAANHRVHPY